jgi:peptidoglycan/xylan/chitin deacetylase (PgdA/CDA1 family)
MNRQSIIILIAGPLLTGCSGMAFAAPNPTATETVLPPAETATVASTPTITPTLTQTSIPTPTWVVQGPDKVLVPILLYHHIGVSPIGSDYYVPPDRFEAELKLLHDWGYTAITTTMLVQAITKGASLPPRPVIITFDDGNEDNYTNAFPSMKKYGFTGVLYIVYYYMDQPNYLSTSQIKEMAAAGWEVGSHTLTHQALISPFVDVRAEVVESRKYLQQALGVPILTFAYPFGESNSAVTDYVHFAGYIAGMGATGFAADQGTSNLFELQRSQIKGSDDVKSFIRFLPWLGDRSFLPTETPTATPTASRTPIPTYTQYPTRTPKISPTP